MKNDEDILNTNRPEPNDYHIPESGMFEDMCTSKPGIKRSLTFYRSTKIKDIQERISYLKKALTKYRQGIQYPYEFYDEYDFDKCISLEIENLQEEYKRSQENDKYIKVIDEYNHKLIAAIYSLCIDYAVFKYSFPDFIKYIETAHFKIDSNVLPHRSFRYLIYFLQTPLGTTWYKSVVENSGIDIKRFGGLRKAESIKNFVEKLDKVYADNKKSH